MYFLCSQLCTSTYSKLVSMCSGAFKTSTVQDLGGIGNDPVFNSLSQLYNPDMRPEDWYAPCMCIHACLARSHPRLCTCSDMHCHTFWSCFFHVLWFR